MSGNKIAEKIGVFVLGLALGVLLMVLAVSALMYAFNLIHEDWAAVPALGWNACFGIWLIGLVLSWSWWPKDKK